MIIDLHTHTYPLSEDSKLGPDELIQTAKYRGLDGICLTEHDFCPKYEEVERLCKKHDFLVLPGMEINVEIGHLLVFGLEKYVFGMHNLDFVRQAVNEVDGFIILAHPHRRRYHKDDDRTIETAVDSASQDKGLGYIDAMEVLNGVSNNIENEFSELLCKKMKLPGTGGSDAHTLLDIASCATVFEKKINNLRELIHELKAGRFRAIRLRCGMNKKMHEKLL